jgi:hypothetical protein
MGRPPLEKKQRQLPVALPADLRDQLEAAAGVAGHSVAEEIRRRIARTIGADAYDEPTRELADDIMRMAAEVELETGAAWHSHAGSHAAFRQAILSRLSRLKPEGFTAFGERPHQSDPGDDPQEIGIWAEHAVWQTRDWSAEERERFRATKESSFQEIVKLHQERKQDGDQS